ncbi:T9SS type A sorting domain-containing protein [Aureispira anguillae]|uniref:T9SS type A sorting domain-containing protein n=1 Tax=Aureispira anguillae TaxID=2864201 RepID=A0A915YEP6_9BACT|nr:T9SS type A sorting domain-containing protein [Aureispira anguillae]BDS11744.1 T9SS type A sorting domain-containing protein [Aureispira anguillae]
MKKILACSMLFLAYFSLEAQVPRKILVEHFTNTLCPPCASRNPGFYTNLSNQTNVLHLSIHSSAPYTQCLLYQQNSGPSDARRSYYTVNSTPTLVMNGFSIPSSNDYSQASIFTPFQGQTSPISIQLQQQKYGNDSLKLRVIVKTVANHNLGAQQLWVGLAEDTVFYNAPNGEGTHYDVFRAQLDLGAVTLPTTLGDSLVYEYNAYANAAWDFSRIFAFAMLQNSANQSVTQSEATTPSTNNWTVNSLVTLPTKVLKGVQLFPNPTKSWLNIRLESSEETRMLLYTISGQLIETHSFLKEMTVNLKHLPKGIYLLRLVNQEGVISKKVHIE